MRMNDSKLVVQTLELKEQKTLKELITELGLDERYHAVLVNGKKISDLKEIIDAESKIIILPKLRGG